ncbi:MAG TPA: hypothetical protein VL426_02515 [Candidatus Binatia bacterium]|nr:hypothetical protein [Candidatus Binatia bacterium]
MRFYVVNRTGVPVHIRLDETDAAKTFLLTLSKSKVGGGRPLTRHVLATSMPLHITFLDGEDTEYNLDDRMGMTHDEYVDQEGDYILALTGFVH